MEKRLEALTSPEVKDRIQQGVETAVWPIGSIEQHGGHCPLGTDGLIAGAIASGVAGKLEALCLPPLWFGVSAHHMKYAGSLTVRPEVLSQMVEDILESLIHHGFKQILILNGHGGNTAAISMACVVTRQRHPEVFLAQSSVWLALNDVYDQLPAEVRQANWRTMVSHGGLLETSVVMALDQTMVKLDQAVVTPMDRFIMATDPVLNVTYRMEELAESGSGGDPTPATAEIGRMFIEKSVERIVAKYRQARQVFRPEA